MVLLWARQGHPRLGCGFLLLFLGVSGALILGPVEARPSQSVSSDQHVSWAEVSVAVVGSLCIVIIVMGCMDICKKNYGFQDFQNEEPSMVTPPAADHFAMFPPVENTPEPIVSSGPIFFEPLPDIRPKTQQPLSNSDLLKPKVAPLYEDGKPNPSMSEDPISDKLKLQNFMHSNTRYQIQRSCLQYIKELGAGWFGKALQGEGSRIQPGHKKTKVLVKMLKDDATLQEQLLFFQEVAAYREIENPHVLKLLGQCTETTPLLVVMEQCPFGDLKTYLCNHRIAVESFSEKGLLLKFACDMAAGLQCLHQHNYIHRDFATRNCLLGSDLSVKVGDYGISEDIHKEDYHVDKSGEAIPIRWLPPENVEYHHSGKVTLKPITKESNVWSYGIAIWEVAQFGSTPFGDLTDEQVLRLVHREKCLKPSRPDTPIYHMDRLYQLMQFCWSEPMNRPSLRELRIMLLHLLSRKTDTDTSAFDQKWNALLPKKSVRSSRSLSPVGNGSIQSPQTNGIKKDVISHPAEIHQTNTDIPAVNAISTAAPSEQKQPELVLSIQDEYNKRKPANKAPPVASPVNELSLEQELAGFANPVNEEYVMDEDLVPPTPPASDILDTSFEIDVATPNRSRASTQPDSLILEIERISEEIALDEVNDPPLVDVAFDKLRDRSRDLDTNSGILMRDSDDFTTSTPKRDGDDGGAQSRNSDYHTAPSQQLSVDLSDSGTSPRTDSDKAMENYKTRKFSDYLATVTTSIDINDESDMTILDSVRPDLGLLAETVEESDDSALSSGHVSSVTSPDVATSDTAPSTLYQTADESVTEPIGQINDVSSKSEPVVEEVLDSKNLNSPDSVTVVDEKLSESEPEALGVVSSDVVINTSSVDSKDSLDDVTVKISSGSEPGSVSVAPSDEVTNTLTAAAVST